ncbi:4738_t:CDS:1 [Paraglomus occultum]|uniref:4738_t:CDS:1 n=1 Tax=Paraglomus occultum TaxID=144539 RepID=A0A9N9G7D7_9GLOM|nr:4738_t:CDS:1 [Paraglomus occultum]
MPNTTPIPLECFYLSCFDACLMQAYETYHTSPISSPSFSPSPPYSPPSHEPPFASAHDYNYPYLSSGDVVEFCGPAYGGKTSILYFTTLTTILPPYWLQSKIESGPSLKITRKFEIGGRGTSVIFFDLDGRFDVSRIYDWIVRHLKRRVEKSFEESNTEESSGESEIQDKEADCCHDWVPTEEEITEIAKDALRRLHVFSPRTPLEFIATLHSLKEYLEHCQQRTRETFTFIMIDSIMAFYWQDRAEESYRGNSISTSSSVYLTQTLHILSSLLFANGLILLTTSWSLISDNSLSTAYPPELVYKDTLSHIWQSFVKYRFVVARQPLPQYEEGTRIAELSRNRRKEREEKRREGLFFGRMVTPACDCDIFEFQINDDGIFCE